MFLASSLIAAMAVLVLMQMLWPRQSLAALGAFLAGGTGLYYAFSTGWLVGLCAVAAVLLIVPLTVYLSLRLLEPYEPQILPTDKQIETAPMTDAERAQLVGLSGVVQTPVDPAGIAFLTGHRVPVLSRTGTLPQGMAVVVERIEGVQVIVRAKG